MKNLFHLIFFIVIAIATACEQNKDYEAFIDKDVQGIEIFDKDFDACKRYATLHSKKSEGSQGAGERLILERNLFITCMKKEGWILKN